MFAPARLDAQSAAVLLVASLIAACETGGGKRTTTSTGPSAAMGRLEEKYDSRNGSTLIRVVPPVPAIGAHLIAGAVFEGRRPTQLPDQLLLGISFRSSQVRFAGCDHIRWRADNNMVAESQVTRDVQLGGGISEFLSGTISFSRARVLAGAAHISADACGVDLAISDAELGLLRQLIQRVTPGAR